MGLVPHEAWIELSPKYVDPMMQDVKELSNQYKFSRVEVVKSQDHFADPYNTPDGKYISTNTAFLEGIADDFDYVNNSEEGKVKFQKIIDYNEDDCIATRVIKDWLVSLKALGRGTG